MQALRTFLFILVAKNCVAFLAPRIFSTHASPGLSRWMRTVSRTSPCRMAFNIPEHIQFRPSADDVDASFHERERLLGATDSWHGCLERRTHFDATALLQTGVLKPKGQGRVLQWSRKAAENDIEYSVWEVLEPGALAQGQGTVTRSTDGHEELRFTSLDATPQQSLVLEPGTATFSRTFGDGEIDKPLTAQLQLCQHVDGSASGYKQGISVTYDPGTGALSHLCRSEQCTIPARMDNPEEPVDFNAVQQISVPQLGEEVAYVSYSCMGNPLGDLVDRARWQGRATVRSFPDGVGGAEKCWTADAGSVFFTSMCFKEVRSGQYSDLRFADGAYMRLPLGVADADAEMVLEFGALRRDRGLHRIVALGGWREGFRTVSYECFS